MPVITFFFAGSGHSIESADDSLVEAFVHCTGPSVFFSGPGGPGGAICVSPDVFDELNRDEHLTQLFESCFTADNRQRYGQECRGRPIIGLNWHQKAKSFSSAKRRSLTGKGWHRATWYAIELLHFFGFHQRAERDALVLNIVGHSRGSITAIMLLNDLLRTFDGLNDRASFSVATPSLMGVKRQLVIDQAGYLDALETTWSWYGIPAEAAQDGRAKLRRLRERFELHNHSAELNAWLFDPVGGDLQGGADRQQLCPYHRRLRRVRVLRMENQGRALSGQTPDFDVEEPYGAKLLSGDAAAANLLDVEDEERLVIPLCGTHGSGLSHNFSKGVPTSWFECVVGTGLMLSFLVNCGTDFDARHLQGKFDPPLLLGAYLALLGKYGYHAPSSDRAWVNPDHGKSGYVSGFINAHHKFLRNGRRALLPESVGERARPYCNRNFTKNEDPLVAGGPLLRGPDAEVDEEDDEDEDEVD